MEECNELRDLLEPIQWPTDRLTTLEDSLEEDGVSTTGASLDVLLEETNDLDLTWLRAGKTNGIQDTDGKEKDPPVLQKETERQTLLPLTSTPPPLTEEEQARPKVPVKKKETLGEGDQLPRTRAGRKRIRQGNDVQDPDVTTGPGEGEETEETGTAPLVRKKKMARKAMGAAWRKAKRRADYRRRKKGIIEVPLTRKDAKPEGQAAAEDPQVTFLQEAAIEGLCKNDLGPLSNPWKPLKTPPPPKAVRTSCYDSLDVTTWRTRTEKTDFNRQVRRVLGTMAGGDKVQFLYEQELTGDQEEDLRRKRAAVARKNRERRKIWEKSVIEELEAARGEIRDLQRQKWDLAGEVRNLKDLLLTERQKNRRAKLEGRLTTLRRQLQGKKPPQRPGRRKGQTRAPENADGEEDDAMLAGKRDIE